MKNHFLNYERLIAAYLVVCIHCVFPGEFGRIMECIARFAVPFFFMVSGYFCLYSEESNQAVKIKGKIVRTLKLILFANIIYLAWNIFRMFITGNDLSGIKDYISQVFEMKNWFSIIVFNQTTISTHLWFLQALLYCYVVMYIVTKYKKYLFSYIISGILLVTHFIISYGFEIEGYYIRNAWLIGIPFFVMGYLLHQHNDKVRRIQSKLMIATIIVGIAISLMEDRLVGTKLVYMGTVIVALSYFSLAIKYETTFKENFFTRLGERCSVNIYIYHPMFIYITFKIFDRLYLSDSAFYYWIHPIAVMISVTIMVYILFIFKYRMIKSTKVKKV